MADGFTTQQVLSMLDIQYRELCIADFTLASFEASHAHNAISRS